MSEAGTVQGLVSDDVYALDHARPSPRTQGGGWLPHFAIPEYDGEIVDFFCLNGIRMHERKRDY